MKAYNENPFIFSPRYRLLRHLLFWLVHIVIFTFVFWPSKGQQPEHLLISTMWALAFIIYCYPVLYGIIPRYLLKERYLKFGLIMLGWATLGWFYNFIIRKYVYFNLGAFLHFDVGVKNPWAPNSYLVMNSMLGFASMIILFKYWYRKQREYMQAENDKVNMELQLLKAQIHPHFLFNTLNNIYSFSMKGSEKAPAMITQLASLLSYILYDCRDHDVPLEKEIEVMKNYMNLEKERYGNKLELSMNMEGEIQGKRIAPLLLLPFIENAFKHGTSEQLERPWLSLDLSVKGDHFRCKIINSKKQGGQQVVGGIGIDNVKRRLAHLYPAAHELLLNEEEEFFVVSLQLQLDKLSAPAIATTNS